MATVGRRSLLGAAGALGALSTFRSELLARDALEDAPQTQSRPTLSLASFRFDVTPPLGHSLCGGWIAPVQGIDDPLEAIGLVILGIDQPLVFCTVDWTGLLNEAHFQWRAALAAAVGTTPDRVTVHCVHQHNAPFACLEAQQIVAAQGDLPAIIDLEFFRDCLQRGEQAVARALQHPRPVTHVARGEAVVSQVASNRRLLGPDGRVSSQRGSSSRDPQHKEAPEGLIDPLLKTIAFYDHDEKIAACHYYACHPMSYYGDGRVSADFCGLARRRRQADEPGCAHLYFSGCGGNIGAGKYNDGSPAMRTILTTRIYDAICQSERELRPQKIESIQWVTSDFHPTVDRKRWEEEKLLRSIGNRQLSVVERNRPSYTVAFLRRCARKQPILLSALHLNEISMIHLPAECFVEYQLEAQQYAPDRFVACAAYGDGGPWYLPTEEAFPQGGYEVSVAWCGAEIDPLLTQGIQSLLDQSRRT